MKRVTGIGGIFFKAKDPKALAEWYRVRRASRWLSPQSCSLWLNILAVKRCRNDRVALWIERDGGDGRPVAGAA